MLVFAVGVQPLITAIMSITVFIRYSHRINIILNSVLLKNDIMQPSVIEQISLFSLFLLQMAAFAKHLDLMIIFCFLRENKFN
jgi:hypothetical protein